MIRSTRNLFAIAIAAPLVGGCGGTAMVQYNMPPKEAGDYKFVVPRIVVRVEAAAAVDKDAKPGKAAPGAKTTLAFTPVPVATGKDGKPLPVFSVTDDSNSGFNLVSTSVTSVTYADNLIIQSLGTTISDNRKAIVDAVFGVLGLAGAGAFASADVKTCPSSLDQFKPVVLQDFQVTGEKQTIRLETNPCWGYQVLDASDVAGTTASNPVVDADGAQGGIPLGTKVSWFPYPACEYRRIKVVECTSIDGKCSPKSDGSAFMAVVGVADGTKYQKMALPPKGKITMHPSFCVADVTSEPSPLSTNWELANHIITSTKSLMKSDSK